MNCRILAWKIGCSVALYGCWLALEPGVQAAQTNVTVENFDFNPSSVTINVNDSVRWVWAGGLHSTTSTSQLWDSGLQSSIGFTFTNVFGSAGNFPYICTQHTFMQGSVTVNSVTANQPPSVSITNPPNAAVFSAPANVTLIATASDPDPGDSVTNVEFRGTSSLGNRTSSPYSLTVSNLGAGAYTFSAIASDSFGAKATNSISISVVTPVDIVLTNAMLLSPTQFRFTYSANAGLRYVIERSATLDNFTAFATNTAAGSSINFTDNAPNLDAEFYRVGRLPNH
jgi:plastocyanin